MDIPELAWCAGLRMRVPSTLIYELMCGFDTEACFVRHAVVSGDGGGVKQDSSSSARFYPHISRALNLTDGFPFSSNMRLRFGATRLC